METTQTQTPETTPTAAAPAPFRGVRGASRTGANRNSRGPGGPNRGGPHRGGPRREERPKPEFDSKTIQVRRVTRVVAGGRRFAFSVAIVAGDRKGSVGVGLGKAQDTASAIAKAMVDAKKKMIRVRMTDTRSLPHQIQVKESSARVELRPNFGKGLVAGSSVRNVLELAGITDVTGKVLSPSRNKLNNARAAVKALRMFAK
jgi:small subunit ribosomal protein S5